MTITVTTCGECPFKQQFDDYNDWCTHPEFSFPMWLRDKINKPTIHPSCPESGPFVIETKPQRGCNCGKNESCPSCV